MLSTISVCHVTFMKKEQHSTVILLHFTLIFCNAYINADFHGGVFVQQIVAQSSTDRYSSKQDVLEKGNGQSFTVIAYFVAQRIKESLHIAKKGPLCRGNSGNSEKERATGLTLTVVFNRIYLF